MINREHKDRLFTFIFGREENKKWTLQLYNAVNGSNYENEDDIELTTIEDAVYMGMKNDLSFLFWWQMNVYEQQLCKALHNCCYAEELLMYSLS